MDNEMIIPGSWDHFLTLKDERLLMVKRRHPYVIIFPAIIVVILTVFFIFSTFLFFVNILKAPMLFISAFFLIMTIFITLLTKCIIDWYFHVYILTTRKIKEVWYAPLSAHVMNDVLLDKVNCTEVDFRRGGLLNELLDMGEIHITFDRPTSQEEFVLKDMQKCYKVGRFLTRQLIDGNPGPAGVQTLYMRGHQVSVR